MKRSRVYARIFAFLMATGGLAGCNGGGGGGGGGTDSDTDTGGTDTNTTGSGNVVFVNGACLVDGDCGDGYGCVLGQCAVGCSDDADCGTGMICDPHGVCKADDGGMDENPFEENGMISMAPDNQLWEVGSTQAVITLTNDGDEEIRYRLDGLHDALMFDGTPAAIPPKTSVDVVVDIDPSAIDQAIDRRIPLQIITDIETLVWTLEIPPTPTGNYLGFLVFNDERLLGQYQISVDLAFDPSGEVKGWIHPVDSLMWPTSILVTGTWDSETGDVSLRMPDTVPIDYPGGGDIEAEAGPFGRSVGRDVVLTGKFSGDGTYIEGTLVETITGLVPTEVELPGSFRLTHKGDVLDPEGESKAADVSGQIPVSLPTWEWPMDLDSGECAGDLGALYGESGSLPNSGPQAQQVYIDACSACADLDCTPQQKVDCAEGLVIASYNVPSVVDESPGQIELPVGAQWSWTECTDQSSDHYIPGSGITCLDPAALRCAGRLLREASIVDTSTETLTALLDQIHKEGTMSALVGTENQIQAAFSYRNVAQSNVAQKELELIKDQTRRLMARASAITNAPGYNNLLAALGKPVLFDDRQGRDVALALTNSSKAIQTLALQLRLLQAVELTDANRDPMRQLVNHTSAWLHVQAALWKDMLEFYEMEDTFNELAVFGEATNTLTSLYQELAPGTNQFGFSPDFVPLKLTAGQAEKGISNFDIVWEDADFLVQDFIMRLENAAAALDEYDTQAFTVTEKKAEIESNYDERIGDLCGYVDGLPDLGGCGLDGAGEIGIQALRIDGAKIRLETAKTALQNNLQTIRYEEDRLREIIWNHQSLEQFIDQAEGAIVNIGNQAGSMKSAARMSAAAKECGFIMGKAAADSVVIVAETAKEVAENLGEMCGTPPVPCPNVSGAVASGAVGAVKVAAELVKGGLDCASAKSAAQLENTLEAVDSWESDQVTIINNQIDQAMRETELKDEIINSKNTVANLTLDSLTLELEVQAARKEVEVAVAEMNKSIGEVAALLKRKERAINLVTVENPLNPMSNPRFLQARLELGKDVLRRRVRTLREAYKAGRALEYHINEDFPQIETMLVSARSATELTDFMTCAMSVSNDFKQQPAADPFDISISLRDDIFGMNDRVVDEVLDEDVTPAEQFRAMLAHPDHVLADGSVELRVTLPLLGDSMFSTAMCDDRLITIEVDLIGENLGDDDALVLVERDGETQLRRCDSADLPADKSVVGYNLGFRQAPIQAHVAGVGGQASGAFTDWPTAGEQWIIRIPMSPQEAPQNQDMNLNNLDDVVLKLNRQARPLSGQFIPDCG